MTKVEELKNTIIRLVTEKGYPAELGLLMAAQLGTEYTMNRMISYLTHVTPGSAEEMVDEMLAISADRDFFMEKKKSEHYQKKYNEILWNAKNE